MLSFEREREREAKLLIAMKVDDADLLSWVRIDSWGRPGALFIAFRGVFSGQQHLPTSPRSVPPPNEQCKEKERVSVAILVLCGRGTICRLWNNVLEG